MASVLVGLLCLGGRVVRASDSAVGDALSQPGGALKIEGVKFVGGFVRGTVMNPTSAEVSEIKLLIRYVWMWKSERTPGEDNPGRSEYDVVPGPIRPGGSLSFEHSPSPPLPLDRQDGRFEVEVSVVGFTQVEH
jgi:hypothetical protein